MCFQAYSFNTVPNMTAYGTARKAENADVMGVVTIITSVKMGRQTPRKIRKAPNGGAGFFRRVGRILGKA